jgi:hypothetical protein
MTCVPIVLTTTSKLHWESRTRSVWYSYVGEDRRVCLDKEGVRHAVRWSPRKMAPLKKDLFLFPSRKQKPIRHPVGRRARRIVSPDGPAVIRQNSHVTLSTSSNQHQGPGTVPRVMQVLVQQLVH